MSNFTESELIPAAVRIILKETNGIETRDLITELRNLMIPSGEDLERLSNRSDDKFSQKVRNLKSHKTLENKGYSKFYANKFFITEKGKKFLNEIPKLNINNNSRNIEKKSYFNRKDLSFEDLMNIFLKSQKNKDHQEILNINKEFERRVSKRKFLGKKPMRTSVSGLEQTQEWLENNSESKTKNNEENQNKKLEKTLLINIHQEIPLSTRLSNSLKDQGIIFIEQLIGLTEKQLLSFPRMGKFGIQEIENILSDLGLNINCLGNLTNDIISDNIPDSKHKNDEDLKKLKPEILKKVSINIINDWPLSLRTFNVLKKENIIFLGDLIFKKPEYLLRLKNFGRNSLNEINELLKTYHIDLDQIYLNENDWIILRKKLEFEIKDREIENEILSREFSKNENIWHNKNLFEDFDSFKKDYTQIDKIVITIDIKPLDLEKLIIEDIDYIISLFTKKYKKIFRARYGYKEKFKTLGEVGKELGVTRERVRQLESKLNRSFSKLGRIEKKSTLNYFKQYSSISFHKLFPNLGKKFYKISQTWRNTSKDKMVDLIEIYLGVNEGYFNTTEKILKNFNFEILKPFLIFTPSEILINDLIVIIKNNYGYDDLTSNLVIEFLHKEEFIKIVNEKVYPIKINKNEEVAHILLNYSKGLHWKEVARIGNKSYTKNKWDLERVVGDSSFSMNGNPHIYLIDRGQHRLIKYLLLEVEDKDQLISLTIDLFKNLNLESCDLERIYKKIIDIERYQDLSFYDLRGIIKLYGVEKGLYHKGGSGQNTISFNKDVKSISIKDKIREIIENFNDEISINEINEKLQKTNEQLPLSTHLDTLEDENIIFKINPGIYLNFKDAIRLCDNKEVEEYLGEILDQYEFITNAFIKEKINENLGYGLSTSYYVSFIKYLAKKNNWFFGFNYFSKKQERKMPVDEYIKINYDENLSNNENYELISKHIGISRVYFNNIMYTKNIELDTDWVHQND